MATEIIITALTVLAAIGLSLARYYSRKCDKFRDELIRKPFINFPRTPIYARRIRFVNAEDFGVGAGMERICDKMFEDGYYIDGEHSRPPYLIFTKTEQVKTNNEKE